MKCVVSPSVRPVERNVSARRVSPSVELPLQEGGDSALEHLNSSTSEEHSVLFPMGVNMFWSFLPRVTLAARVPSFHGQH